MAAPVVKAAELVRTEAAGTPAFVPAAEVPGWQPAQKAPVTLRALLVASSSNIEAG